MRTPTRKCTRAHLSRGRVARQQTTLTDNPDLGVAYAHYFGLSASPKSRTKAPPMTSTPRRLIRRSYKQENENSASGGRSCGSPGRYKASRSIGFSAFGKRQCLLPALERNADVPCTSRTLTVIEWRIDSTCPNTHS